MQIGNLRLTLPALLAPMSGITCLPYRMLNRAFGCECAFLEMINARALHYCTKRTHQLMPTQKEDRPLGVQLLGCEQRYVCYAIERLREYQFDILDLNAACPRRKIVTRGEGAALLKDPQRLRDLLKVMVNTSTQPVTVKIRIGWDDAKSARDIALYAQDSGIAALFVHGRTCTQSYSGTVDYGAIREIKKSLHIPVIGSGDIFSVPQAKRMMDETGVDGVLVARGALGNPWIFAQLRAFFKGGLTMGYPEITEVVCVMKDHLDAFIALYGERRGILKYRKFLIWYTRGFSRVKQIRHRAQQVKTQDETVALIEEFKGCARRYPSCVTRPA
ncbi:MAG: tRNA dihydrouridine synthase DusB [Candidatus Omnitrophica bacterium]|nr:tRNA dihydrouridine synthase DusB [Candidatus Omnitrophota bacterium]